MEGIIDPGAGCETLAPSIIVRNAPGHDINGTARTDKHSRFSGEPVILDGVVSSPQFDINLQAQVATVLRYKNVSDG